MMSGSADTKDTHKGCSSQTASPEMRNLILEKLTVLRVMINNNMTVVETLKSMTSPTTSTPGKPDTPVNDTEGKGKELPSKADNNH
ncbi:hypothetical protein K4K61_004657 [Colletotrichum sp. SAR11_59]|nr:hypothetical protein K4K61_004657 [Colletotrichum sp. SAR11_59]